MKKLFKIESDCLDIIKRIKSIDKNYFVVFDLDLKQYQLHNSGQFHNSYCLTFPFDCLDERAYLHVLKTRVQNSDSLFEEIDRQNKLLEKKQINQVLNNFKERFYDS